jgi:hypothetical protein
MTLTLAVNALACCECLGLGHPTMGGAPCRIAGLLGETGGRSLIRFERTSYAVNATSLPQ